MSKLLLISLCLIIKNSTFMENSVLTSANAVGVQINRENREKAKTILESAKEREAKLIADGAIWMRKEKTTVLVPKDKVNQYKLNGFK